METANRSTIIERIAKKYDFYQKDIEPIVNSVFEELEELLVEKRETHIHGFGKFSLKTIPCRTVPHPGTGKMITIPKQYGISFTPMPKLKKRISKIPVDLE